VSSSSGDVSDLAVAVEAAVREAWTTAVWGDKPPLPGDAAYEAMMYAQTRAWERSNARAALMRSAEK
jgi:hypothetical protein